MNHQDSIIYSYTRKQALEDGLQVCVSDLFPSDTRMFKYPVYFTSKVWQLCQNQAVIVWDICSMAVCASEIGKTDSSMIEYYLTVSGSEIPPEFFEDGSPIYRLWAECGAKDLDDPTPVITIMFPNEH